jgi:protein-tyrosine phosphatase
MGIMRKGHIAWNATQVWERLWLGGIADAEQLATGNPHRIATVVSLSEMPVEAKRRGVNYLHLPIEDEEPVHVRQFDAIMDALIENIRWGTVLLHCGVGVSRAPSIAGAYMDAVGFKNVDAALKEIRQLRPFISPSTVLVESLKENLR